MIGMRHTSMNHPLLLMSCILLAPSARLGTRVASAKMAERICPTPGMMFNTKEIANIARAKYQNSFLSALPSN